VPDPPASPGLVISRQPVGADDNRQFAAGNSKTGDRSCIGNLQRADLLVSRITVWGEGCGVSRFPSGAGK
jgi:hypothetical protein